MINKIKYVVWQGICSLERMVRPRQNGSEPVAPASPGEAIGKAQTSECETSHRTLSDFARSLQCPEIMAGWIGEKMFRESESCKRLLCLWRSAGYPDLGGMPGIRDNLLEFACYRILQVCKWPNDRS